MEKSIISEKMKEQGVLGEVSVKPDYRGKTLNIEIASGCNENCIYCWYAANGLHRNIKMIDEQLFKRVAKEAHGLGITDIGLYITSEPLLNPKVYEYVSYLKKEIGFPYVYISTNGILCTPENLERLAKAGIDSIKFSISGGTRESFYQHHGVDKFELVLENLKYAYEYRQKNGLSYGLYLFSILTRFNHHEKALIEERFSPYVDEIIFTDVVNGVIKIKGLEEYLMKDKDVRSRAGESRTLPCAALFKRIYVDVEGYLLACCDVVDEHSRMIDLHHQSLQDAVYSEKMIRLRNMHLQKNIGHTICNRCIFGKEEPVKALNDLDGEYMDIVVPDRTKEIRKRFHIDDIL